MSRHLDEILEINASPERVFRYLDNMQSVGEHMMKSSMPLMGGKLKLERLSSNPTGVSATYRYRGRVLFLPIDFSETVIEWVETKRKIWKTIGTPKLIILGNYEMGFELEQTQEGTKAHLWIDYEIPRPWFGRILGMLLADWYSRWCLRMMGSGAKNSLEDIKTKRGS